MAPREQQCLRSEQTQYRKLPLRQFSLQDTAREYLKTFTTRSGVLLWQLRTGACKGASWAGRARGLRLAVSEGLSVVLSVLTPARLISGTVSPKPEMP